MTESPYRGGNVNYFARSRVRQDIGRQLHEKINEVCDPEYAARMKEHSKK